jgi:WD40 repeat protein
MLSPANIEAVTAASGAARVAIATRELGVRLRDVHSGSVLAADPSLRGGGQPLAISADGVVIATRAVRRPGGCVAVRVLECADVPLWEDLPDSDCRTDVLALASDGGLVAALTASGDIGIWQSVPARLLTRLDTRGVSVSGLAFSPNQQWLVSVMKGGRAIIWDVSSWRAVAEAAGVPEPAGRVAFVRGSSRFAVGGDGQVTVWEIFDPS